MRVEQLRGPRTLTGRYVELGPIARTDAPALLHAARDPAVSQHLLRPIGPDLPALEGLIDRWLEGAQRGEELPFVTRLRQDGTVVGMSRYIHIDPENDSVEIGGTFLDSRFWRTPLNTDAKLAQLRHAFEAAAVHRVWLQTDLTNTRSQTAIARLGAVREGVLREDRRRANGTYRNSVVFSILASEWPRARANLERALERPWAPPGPEAPVR